MRELLQSVVTLAEQAGAVIQTIYDRDFAVVDKADKSPLTEADLASHHVIVDGLGKISSLPVVSEESAGIAWEQRKAWSTYWLIDPLDGTKEFIKRNGEFTVNIALIDNGVAVLGVVYAPVLKRSYYAAKGVGAFRQDNGGAPVSIRVSSGASPESWRVVGSRSHHSEQMAAFLEHIGKHSMLPMGSSLKLCLVAEGAADLYPRLAPTSEWDTAAAQAVVEQAGGEVLDDTLQPLLYNSKDSMLNPHFIVCGKREPAWTGFFNR